MAKPFEECKVWSQSQNKPVEMGELLKTQVGREELAGATKKPCKDPKWEGWTINRNKWIKEQLEMHTDDVEPNRMMEPVVGKIELSGTGNDSLEVIMNMLEEILDILKKEEVPGTSNDEGFDFEKGKGWNE